MKMESLVQFAQTMQTRLRLAKLASRPKDQRKRKGRPVDASVQKARIMAARRHLNLREWQRFLGLGYDRVWRALWEEEPVCPSLHLDTAEFRDRLLLGEVPVYRRRPGEVFQCALHWAVVQKSCGRPYHYCKPPDRRVGSRSVESDFVSEDRIA